MPSADVASVRRDAMRKALFQLVLGICVLDAVVISVWFGTGMPHAASNVRTEFAVVWMILTAVIVAFLLRRVRRARMMR